MNRELRPLAFLACAFLLAPILHAADMALSPQDRLLILAPHPDDEVLCCGGLIQQAQKQHIPVKVLLLTNGDFNFWSYTRYRRFPAFRPQTMRHLGNLRRDESLAAGKVLGLGPEHFVFLGYPDYGTLTIWKDHWSPTKPFRSRMTHAEAVPYPTAYRPGAAYTGDDIQQDLESVIREWAPTKLFFPHPSDDRPDHLALSLFAQKALQHLGTACAATAYVYLIHAPGWPQPKGFHPMEPLLPPSGREKQGWFPWPLTEDEVQRKLKAIQEHKTQWSYSREFLQSLVRKNELFGLWNEAVAEADHGSEAVQR